MGLPRTFNVVQAALHVRLHVSTIYRWIATGFLPVRRRFIGKGFAIRDQDVEACAAKARGSTWGKRTPRRPHYLRAKAANRAKLAAMSSEERDKHRKRVREYYHRRKRRQGP